MNKENWPALRLFWLKNPAMSSLQRLASHLQDKTAGRGSYPRIQGSTEAQTIDRLGGLEQQVYVLTDVVQVFLQVVAEEHWQRTHKVERALAWIRKTWEKFWLMIEQNKIYRIVAIIVTIAGAVAGLWGLFRYFHLFGR